MAGMGGGVGRCETREDEDSRLCVASGRVDEGWDGRWARRLTLAGLGWLGLQCRCLCALYDQPWELFHRAQTGQIRF